MNVTEFALALVERHKDLLGANPDIVEGIAQRYAEEVGGTADVVYALFEDRAGFASTVDELRASNRLGNPRLRTTYPNERRRALTARVLGWNDKLAEILPELLELAVKRELAQAELAEERSRDRDYADAEEARRELGVYVETVDTLDALYNDYQVTRRHYACVTDQQLRDIAAILRREPPHTIPVVPRNRGR